ncbi:MAG: helix-turn-helix domain-containing protein [Firmicutes bacterium]|nr:helix-turn-helix domain-containing protein [Bacillota bacterium]
MNLNNTNLNLQNIFTNFKDVVKVKDLQKMLGIGRNLAYELIATNKIKSIKSGNLILIPKQNVIDYLNNGGANNE